jgi:hypothetical protein
MKEIKSIRECNYCGKQNLIWKEENNQWKLYEEETNKVHRCQDNFKDFIKTQK